MARSAPLAAACSSYSATPSDGCSSSPTRPIEDELYFTESEEEAPRPKNAWILYRGDKYRELYPKDPTGKPGPQMGIVSGEIAALWKNESKAVKDHYAFLADQAKAEHMAKYLLYRFQPKSKEQRQLQHKRRVKREKAIKEAKRAAEAARRAEEKAAQAAARAEAAKLKLRTRGTTKPRNTRAASARGKASATSTGPAPSASLPPAPLTLQSPEDLFGFPVPTHQPQRSLNPYMTWVNHSRVGGQSPSVPPLTSEVELSPAACNQTTSASAQQGSLMTPQEAGNEGSLQEQTDASGPYQQGLDALHIGGTTFQPIEDPLQPQIPFETVTFDGTFMPNFAQDGAVDQSWVNFDALNLASGIFSLNGFDADILGTQMDLDVTFDMGNYDGAASVGFTSTRTSGGNQFMGMTSNLGQPQGGSDNLDVLNQFSNMRMPSFLNQVDPSIAFSTNNQPWVDMNGDAFDSFFPSEEAQANSSIENQQAMQQVGGQPTNHWATTPNSPPEIVAPTPTQPSSRVPSLRIAATPLLTPSSSTSSLSCALSVDLLNTAPSPDNSSSVIASTPSSSYVPPAGAAYASNRRVGGTWQRGKLLPRVFSQQHQQPHQPPQYASGTHYRGQVM